MESLFRISLNAKKDIKNIMTWYDERSIQAADQFLDELNLFINKIVRNPQLYKTVGIGVRRCLLKTFLYTIYFSQQRDFVYILRVRHKKQQPLKRYT